MLNTLSLIPPLIGWRMRAGLAQELWHKHRGNITQAQKDADPCPIGSQAQTILFWAIPMSFVVWANFSWHWSFWFLPLLFWGGKRCCDWGESWNLKTLKDWIVLYWCSFLLTGPAAIILILLYNSYVLIPAFFFFPLAYLNRFPAKPEWYTRGFTEWAENIYPLSVALGVLFLS